MLARRLNEVVRIYDDSLIPGILFTPAKLCWRKHHDLHADLLRTVEIIRIWLVDWHDKWIIPCVSHPPNDICDYCRQDVTNPNDDVAGQTMGFARQLPTKRTSDKRNPVPNLVSMFSMTSWNLVSLYIRYKQPLLRLAKQDGLRPAH